MTTALIIIALIAIITGFVGYKLWSAGREIERVLKVNASLEQENQQQKAEIAAKKVEVKHASISRHNHETVARSDAISVDGQLHTHNWFRAKDSGNGLSGVSQNLSKPSRHDGNETSDSGSQSDSSGDL